MPIKIVTILYLECDKFNSFWNELEFNGRGNLKEVWCHLIHHLMTLWCCQRDRPPLLHLISGQQRWSYYANVWCGMCEVSPIDGQSWFVNVMKHRWCDGLMAKWQVHLVNVPNKDHSQSFLRMLGVIIFHAILRDASLQAFAWFQALTTSHFRLFLFRFILYSTYMYGAFNMFWLLFRPSE